MMGYSKENDSTRVDLGEDLLAEREPAPVPNNVEAGDLHKNAQIFFSEGLFEDCKKTLFKILRSNPQDREAEDLLYRLRQAELAKILRSEVTEFSDSFNGEDLEAIARALENDINPESNSSAKAKEFSLFSDTEAVEKYGATLVSENQDDVHTLIDVGIAHFEMELFVVSTQLFSAAWKLSRNSVRYGLGIRVTSAGLLAQSLYFSKQYFRACEVLEEEMNDSDIPEADKLELFYWAGRANEALGRADLARNFYARISQSDGNYRDVKQRLYSRNGRETP